MPEYHCHSPYGDPCNPYCDPYNGTDFNGYLEDHILSSESFMSLPWDPKTIRRNVIKFWYELETSTKEEWRSYSKKFGKDVNPTIPEKYNQFLKYIDTLEQVDRKNRTEQLSWEENVMKAYDVVFGSSTNIT